MEVLVSRIPSFPRPVTCHLGEALEMANIRRCVVREGWSTFYELGQGKEKVEEVELEVHLDKVER